MHSATKTSDSSNHHANCSAAIHRLSVPFHTKHSTHVSAIRVTEINTTIFFWICNLGNPLWTNTKCGTSLSQLWIPKSWGAVTQCAPAGHFWPSLSTEHLTDQAGSTDIPDVPSFTFRGKCTVVTALRCFPQFHQMPSQCPKLSHYHFPHIINHSTPWNRSSWQLRYTNTTEQTKHKFHASLAQDSFV